MREEKTQKIEELATKNQLRTLQNLEIPVSRDISKLQAMRIIKSRLGG